MNSNNIATPAPGAKLCTKCNARVSKSHFKHHMLFHYIGLNKKYCCGNWVDTQQELLHDNYTENCRYIKTVTDSSEIKQNSIKKNRIHLEMLTGKVRKKYVRKPGYTRKHTDYEYYKPKHITQKSADHEMEMYILKMQKEQAEDVCFDGSFYNIE